MIHAGSLGRNAQPRAGLFEYRFPVRPERADPNFADREAHDIDQADRVGEEMGLGKFNYWCSGADVRVGKLDRAGAAWMPVIGDEIHPR